MKKQELVIIGTEVWLRIEYFSPAGDSLMVEYAKHNVLYWLAPIEPDLHPDWPTKNLSRTR
jgi:hypothetical protein